METIKIGLSKLLQLFIYFLLAYVFVSIFLNFVNYVESRPSKYERILEDREKLEKLNG